MFFILAWRHCVDKYILDTDYVTNTAVWINSCVSSTPADSAVMGGAPIWENLGGSKF